MISKSVNPREPSPFLTRIRACGRVTYLIISGFTCLHALARRPAAAPGAVRDRNKPNIPVGLLGF